MTTAARATAPEPTPAPRAGDALRHGLPPWGELSLPGVAPPEHPAGPPASRRLPEDLARTWLGWQCQMIAGVMQGALVVARAGESPRVLVAWPQDSEGTSLLLTAGQHALTARDGVVQPRERYVRSGQGICDVLACPVLVDGEPAAAVAVMMATRSEPQQRAVLQLLHWGAVWMEHALRQQAALRGERLPVLLDLVAEGLRPGSVTVGASVVCNLLADRLACERVSVGLARGLQVRLVALSNSSRFDRRLALGHALEAAMEEAVDQGTTVVYPEPPGEAGTVTRAHAELSGRHGSGAVCTVPLRDASGIVGALTLERAEGRGFEPPVREVCEKAGELLGPILALKRRDARSVPARARDGLREGCSRLLGPGRLPLKLALIAAAGALAALVLVQGDQRVAAQASLEGVVQQALVAPQDGFVAEAHTRAGDTVRAGDLLASLDARDLELEREKWRSEREKHLREEGSALASHDRAQVSILRARVLQADAQLRLVEEQLERTRLRAPFDGVVVTGDLSHALGSPVARGQVLFEVAPLDDYRVALEVDEHDVAWLRAGQSGELRLAGLPDRPLAFTVERVTPMATAEEGRNYFRAEARLAEGATALRPGMQGVAKVTVARGSLLRVWTRPLLDRVRLWAWSRGI